MSKIAIIIKGNSKFIDTPDAQKFYDDIAIFLLGFDYKTCFEFCENKNAALEDADLIIGHSNGALRLNNCKNNALLIALGITPEKIKNKKVIVINHPIDEIYLRKCYQDGSYDYPIPEHYIFTEEMKQKILGLIFRI